MAKEKEKKKKTGKIVSALKRSPLNYLSDLVIVSSVLLWIFDSLYETLIASIVTLSSVVVSIRTEENCYDTSMWSSIGSNIALPLMGGVLTWMLKNAGQHWIANKNGERAHEDFPNDEDDGEGGGDGETEQGIEFINFDEDESEESG